jgi:hypothetical protein
MSSVLIGKTRAAESDFFCKSTLRLKSASRSWRSSLKSNQAARRESTKKAIAEPQKTLEREA